MIPEFDKLNDAEIELMFKAPLLVSILVAGADGDIDNKEIKETLAIAKQPYQVKSILGRYFTLMAEDFEDKIKILLQSYPYEAGERNSLIVSELSQLSAVWRKLNREFSVAYYEMLKTMAQRVAASSGGLWGMNTIGSDEAAYLNLPMISDPAKI